MTRRVMAFGVGCFILGAVTAAGLPQARKATFSPALVAGKEPKDAARALLEGALELADNGSWERIAVGRAWYLSGDKEKGQAMFDAVTANNRAEGSDWIRLGRIYAEAGEWDKAQGAFEQALKKNANDDSLMIEYGALANIKGDRSRAEALFEKAMKREPREFWHWVAAGGSYLGVRPQ
jgi:tetratricopeptide (TPR) repeat protein